jgi:glutathione S-transferase
MAVRFYYAAGTCALASRIALEHVGTGYEAVRIDFGVEQQKSPRFLGVNPKGRVPALVADEGVITETPAILLYICQCFPEAGLAPLDDPFSLAMVQSFNSYLCSTVHVAHAHRMRGSRWRNDASAHESMQRKVPQSVGDAFTLIEDELLMGPWLMGEAYGIADMYLFTLAQWLEADGVDLERLPRVLDHRERVGRLPAVQQALESEASS